MSYSTTRPSRKSARSPASRGAVTTQTLNGFGVLRSVLERARLDAGCSLGELTTLSAQVDSYRLDTPAGHRDGKWLAQHLNKSIGTSWRIHWRGLHYVLVSGESLAVKADGEIYRNTEKDWLWLSEVAGKAARWLGYVPFERIADNRNAEPIIHHKARVKPKAFVTIGLDVTIPSVDDIEPTAIASGFEPRQAFHFAIFGEKASLEDVVLPIAREKQADLYLPTGEISDTLIHRIAKDADDDGRPLVMFTLADCDPAGRQMSVSIGRKLQALRDLLFPKLRFEVVPVALNPEQVAELGLPSTPLKETEKRADRWREAFGIEQTEIDALATLRPDVLREIVERAFDPYVDRGLEERVILAEAEWRQQAEEALREQIDQEHLEALRTEATGRLGELRGAIDDINTRLRMAAADHFTLPTIVVAQPDIDEDAPRQALVALDQDWAEATRALIKRKAYRGGCVMSTLHPTTFARAAFEYDKAHEQALPEAITKAIVTESKVSDANAIVLRTGEAAQALLTALACVLVMSPSATRSPTAVRKTVDDLGKRLRRPIAAAEKDADLAEFVRRNFWGSDEGGHA